MGSNERLVGIDYPARRETICPVKNRLQLILLFVLAFGAGTVTAHAAEAFSTKNYMPVNFGVLASYSIDLGNPEVTGSMTEEEYAASKIPAAIKELDGKRVVVPAYMLPLVFADGGVTQFLGMASTTSCCYGQEPILTEIIAVKMKTGTTQALMDSPLFLYGTLRVGPVVQDGYVTAVYSLECDKVSW